MATVYTYWCRGRRLYGIDYLDELTGRRIRDRIAAPDKKLADAEMARRLTRIKEAKVSGARSLAQYDGVKFDDFIKSTYDPLIGTTKTEAGQKTDRHVIKKYLSPTFGGLLLRDVTTAMVKDYARKRRVGVLGAAAQPATVNRELHVLSAIFREACLAEVVADNPVRRVKKFRVDNGRLRYLTPQEEALLLAHSPDYMRPIISLAIHTGLRKGELLSLTWLDVDLENRLLTVRASKTGKTRYIPLNKVAMAVLRRLERFTDTRYVLVNPETHNRWCDLKPIWRRKIMPALVKKGVQPFRFHDLRHTFASRLVQAGVPLNTVRELLGHGSMAMTLRYAHLAPSNLRDAVSVLARPAASQNRAQVGKLLANPRVAKATGS